jgi:hypothetical protein
MLRENNLNMQELKDATKNKIAQGFYSTALSSA